MPELPEVETVMRGLRARMEGRVIERAEVRRPALRWPLPEGLAARLAGRRVLGFRRRAKYILMRLEGGESLLLHLGMSGRMNITPRGSPDAPPGGPPGASTSGASTGGASTGGASTGGPDRPTAHEHVVMETEDGWRVGFVDPRRFGSVHLVPTAEEDAHRLLAGLGPEPLDDAFTGESLSASLAGRRTPAKAALLDQRVVAGLGNIYVCEALFRAGIAPDRLAAGLAGEPAARLVPEIKATLHEAIAAGGSSLRDYVRPDGELGYFQHAWKVYGRESQPCERCPGPPGCPGVARRVQAGRSTFYCPRTQR